MHRTRVCHNLVQLLCKSFAKVDPTHGLQTTTQKTTWLTCIFLDSQMNLVCNSTGLQSHLTMMYYAGILVANGVWGPVCDL